MRYRTDDQGRKRVTVIPGDGIGPEVVGAAMRVVDATGVAVAWERCEAGRAVFLRGVASGVPAETLASVAETRVVLKGPLETPVGYGEKSANVTLRKLFETYGNIRPVREMPGVPTPYRGRGIDLVVVRENVEDLYAGIEHLQTPGVAQCLKIMTRRGCEKIARLAFEVARAEGRKRVHCATKANIMKLSEGMLKRAFEDVAKDYPDIEARHILVDNCAHKLVVEPESFDVIVTSNMNGDILSDLTSGLIGGLGFAPGANIGTEVAMFEAVHGSAPDIAGAGVANPSAVILSAAMMLRHLDEVHAARRIEEAVLAALEDGVYTRDVRAPGATATTTEFADAVIARLGRSPRGPWKARDYRRIELPEGESVDRDYVRAAQRRTAGVDVFVESALAPVELGRALESLVEGTGLKLKMVSNRGTMVYPDTGAMTECVDHWRCRFIARDAGREVGDDEVRDVLARVASRFRWMHVEKLMEFDGRPAYTRAQGED